MEKCKECGGIKICRCSEIPIIIGRGADSPQEIPNDQD